MDYDRVPTLKSSIYAIVVKEIMNVNSNIFQRYRQDDLRTKIKKTLDNENDRGNNGDMDPLVEFKRPKYEMETDEDVLNR